MIYVNAAYNLTVAAFRVGLIIYGACLYADSVAAWPVPVLAAVFSGALHYRGR